MQSRAGPHAARGPQLDKPALQRKRNPHHRLNPSPSKAFSFPRSLPRLTFLSGAPPALCICFLLAFPIPPASLRPPCFRLREPPGEAFQDPGSTHTPADPSQGPEKSGDQRTRQRGQVSILLHRQRLIKPPDSQGDQTRPPASCWLKLAFKLPSLNFLSLSLSLLTPGL